jgi:hypothetical protein
MYASSHATHTHQGATASQKEYEVKTQESSFNLSHSNHSSSSVIFEINFPKKFLPPAFKD